jgi:hypothetical protein
MPDCDVNIATTYNTAEPTFRSRKGKKLAYLVQHYTPSFFAEGSEEQKIAKSNMICRC